MKERPILFSAPMVRALLAGTKTQTRRIIKPQPSEGVTGFWYATHPESKRWTGAFCKINMVDTWVKCPYGQPGDRLWVKETTVNVEAHGFVGPVYAESEEGHAYRSWGLGPNPVEVEPEDVKLRPSLFMTRKMARILLEVTAIRVERLQDITEEDAKAEGIVLSTPAEKVQGEKKDLWKHGNAVTSSPVRAYKHLWESINGPESWDANPWVWIVEFKRVTP